jgi:predicted MFS family arabinose efflux permease
MARERHERHEGHRRDERDGWDDAREATGPTDPTDLTHPTDPADLGTDDPASPITPGSARNALRYPVFRRVFAGAFLSNIGTWMQNVVLGALAYDLTDSSTFVGVVIFAQLGPALVLAPIGGVLADRIDRRRLLVAIAAWQLVLSLVLTALVIPDDPNRIALVVVVAGIGIAQAIYMPTYVALLPQLVDRRDIPGAVSLNSAQMNSSRVIGPALGALLDSRLGAAPVFALNALSYLFIIWAVLGVRLPRPRRDGRAASGLRALGDGFRVARRDPVITRCLVTIFTLSLVSLPFIGQFPVLAERNLGIDERSVSYGVLYACFGMGAVLGALSIGTVFRRRSKAQTGRVAVGVFAVALATLALLRHPAPAYPVLVAVGSAYMALATSLMTVLQERVTEQTRGRVMSLWIMGWAGMVPVGNLLAGPLIEATSVTTVLLVGAAWAAVLALVIRLDLRATPRPDRPLEAAVASGCGH